MVADLLADPGSEGVAEEQVECFVDGMIDALGEDETQAFVDDPDAWTGEQVEIAIDEGLDGATEKVDAFGSVLEDVELDAADDDDES